MILFEGNCASGNEPTEGKEEFRKKEERPKIDWESPIDAAGGFTWKQCSAYPLEPVRAFPVPVAADAKKKKQPRGQS